jgi:Zn-dependent peptidase ImmA (M78 family)/DNA-binding XRE family transcriptional regulator
MASERLTVAPAVLIWARTTGGLTLEAAAKRIAVSEATLAKWESGDLKPTINQLRNAASAYHRPLSALLLPEPPEESPPIADFRRFDLEDDRPWSAALRTAVRQIESQRQALLEVHAASSETETLTTEFVAADPGTEAPKVAERIRIFLSFDDVPTRTWGRPYDAFNAAVSAIESRGVLVVQVGGVPISEMRGFSIAQWPTPVIALNGGDWPRPRLFTLLHEMAHLTFRSSGLCDLHETVGPAHRQNDVLEHRCNAVAAAVLMPDEPFMSYASVVAQRDPEWSLDGLQQVGGRFGASSEAALLRLIALGRADWRLYALRKPELDRAYAEARQAQQAKQRERDGGPDHYTVKVGRLGRAYVRSVLEAFDADNISARDVTAFLNVRYDQLPKIREAAGVG